MIWNSKKGVIGIFILQFQCFTVHHHTLSFNLKSPFFGLNHNIVQCANWLWCWGCSFRSGCSDSTIMAATTNPALSPATQEQLKWQHAAKWVRGRKRETPTTVSRGTVDWAAARLVRQLKLRWLFLVHSAHLSTMSTLKKSRQVDFVEINEGLTSFVTDLSKLETVLYFQPRFMRI